MSVKFFETLCQWMSMNDITYDQMAYQFIEPSIFLHPAPSNHTERQLQILWQLKAGNCLPQLDKNC